MREPPSKCSAWKPKMHKELIIFYFLCIWISIFVVIFYRTYVHVVVAPVPLQYESYFKARKSSRCVILGAVIENNVGNLVAWYIPARVNHTAVTLLQLFWQILSYLLVLQQLRIYACRTLLSLFGIASESLSFSLKLVINLMVKRIVEALTNFCPHLPDYPTN